MLLPHVDSSQVSLTLTVALALTLTLSPSPSPSPSPSHPHPRQLCTVLTLIVSLGLDAFPNPVSEGLISENVMGAFLTIFAIVPLGLGAGLFAWAGYDGKRAALRGVVLCGLLRAGCRVCAVARLTPTMPLHTDTTPRPLTDAPPPPPPRRSLQELESTPT